MATLRPSRAAERVHAAMRERETCFRDAKSTQCVRVRYRFSEPEACALIPAEASFNESTKLFSADCRKPIEAFIMKICTYKQFGDLMFQAGMFRDFLETSVALGGFPEMQCRGQRRRIGGCGVKLQRQKGERSGPWSGTNPPRPRISVLISVTGNDTIQQ